MTDLLLLDNDDRIVELLSWFLSERGFKVRTASSFVEARERLADGAPDLLISDVDLGSESAVTELPKLSSEGLLPLTLVVSGYLDADVQAAIMSVPEVLDTLAKPFEFTELEAKIRLCLSGDAFAAGLPGSAAAADEADTLAPTAPPVPAVASEPAAGDAPVVSRESAPNTAPAAGAAPPGDDAATEDDDGWIEITPR